MSPESRPYFRAFYKHNRLSFILSLFFYALMSAQGVIVSWMLGAVIDAIAQMDLAALGRAALVMAVFVPLSLLVDLLAYRFKTRFVHKGLSQYKALAFDKLSEKGISAFTRENTGRYLSALTNDAGSVEENYLSRFPILVYYSLQFVLSLGMMLYYSPLLTAGVLGLSLLPVLVSLPMGKGLARRERQVSDENEGFTARLKDLLGGFTVIKSFKAEPQARGLFGAANNTLERTKERRRWYSCILAALSQCAGTVVQFGIFLIGAVLAIRGRITVGTVLIFVNLCNFVIQPINTVPEYWAGRKAAKALVEKLAALTAESSGRGGEAIPAALTEGLELEGLSFAYGPDAPALRELSFRFEPGRSYAVVGPSGSGKSTLLSLLMGAYDDYTGHLRIDGRELREVSSDSLYELMSLVGQSVFVFDDSIRRNITMFRDFPDSEVRHAAERAGLAPVLTERGEDYRCGENGVNLSGGERQRIAIARALLRGSRVLLVDEATSALDAETASRVAGSILDLEGLTRIVVTHRLEPALLRRYDRILVLKNGRLCEHGSFEELMAKKEQFYALYTVANG